MHRGYLFKNIRKNRGYSQKKVTNQLISQGSYSRFESEIQDLDADVYIQIIKRMNISLEEFEFLHNKGHVSKQETIIKNFFSINYNNIDKVIELKSQIINLSIDNPIDELSEILLICEAFIILHREKNMEKAKEIVRPIWTRISQYDQWYLNDLKLINIILFLFPIDTVIDLTKNVIKRLEVYNGFINIEQFRSSLIINLSLLLIKNGFFQQAEVLIVNSLNRDKKKMNYIVLALHFSRLAICYSHLKKSNVSLFLKKAYDLVDFFEDESYFKRLEAEFLFYSLR